MDEMMKKRLILSLSQRMFLSHRRFFLPVTALFSFPFSITWEDDMPAGEASLEPGMIKWLGNLAFWQNESVAIL